MTRKRIEVPTGVKIRWAEIPVQGAMIIHEVDLRTGVCREWCYNWLEDAE